MTTFLFAVALALIVAGVALLSIPWACVVAGALLGASTWAYDAGDDGDSE